MCCHVVRLDVPYPFLRDFSLINSKKGKLKSTCSCTQSRKLDVQIILLCGEHDGLPVSGIIHTPGQAKQHIIMTHA